MSTGWKAVLQLGREEKMSKLEDEDRVEAIMDYLLEKAPKSCFINEERIEVQLPFLFGR